MSSAHQAHQPYVVPRVNQQLEGAYSEHHVSEMSDLVDHPEYQVDEANDDVADEASENEYLHLSLLSYEDLCVLVYIVNLTRCIVAFELHQAFLHIRLRPKSHDNEAGGETEEY